MTAILAHEHPLSAGTSSEEVSQLLRLFKEHGGELIVDVTPKACNLPRNPTLLKSLAKMAEIEVIFSTAYYKEPYIPMRIQKLSVEAIAEEFIREIEEGIEGTGIRPAVIGEVGTSFRTITPSEEKILRAAAIAQRYTGLPIITHTTHGTMGIEQLDILERSGADLNKVIVGHSDLNSDIKYHLEIIRRGANLGFDTVGKERWASASLPGELAYQPDAVRIKLILDLFEQGAGDKIVASLDMLYKEKELNINTHGRYGYTYIFVFLEKLREAGLSRAECKALVEKNPRRILKKEQQNKGT